MKKKHKNIKTGIFTLLPIIVFIAIIKWCIEKILTISDMLFIPFNNTILRDSNNDIYWYWHIVGIVAMIIIIQSIGWLMNHYYIGKKINALIQPIIKKTPVLNTLTRISKQVSEITQNKTSFKEVVFVEFPKEGIYSVGFVTSENIQSAEKILGKKMYSIFIPTTPNPTNGFICIVPEEKIIKTNISITNGIEYVISMGTLINLESIEEEIQEIEKNRNNDSPSE